MSTPAANIADLNTSKKPSSVGARAIVRPNSQELRALLADIAQDNMHVDVGFGPAVGAEAF